MADDTIELNRRRVLGGIITVGAAAAAAGAGTFAAFSDTETSSENTIQAGTLNLQSPSATGFPIENLVPGDSVSGTVTATYDSTSDVDSVNVSLDLSLSENDLTPTPSDNTIDQSAATFAELLSLTTATLSDGTNTYNILNNISDSTTGPGGSEYTSLEDVVTNAPYTDALQNVNPGNDVTVTIEGTFVSSATNDAQGDGIDLGVQFDANQP